MGITPVTADPPPARYDDLRALFFNCTLKRSPERSHTQGLIDRSAAHHGARRASQVDVVRAVDHDIATGVWPDMTEHGWASDAWPAIYEQVMAADILVLAGPIWLGDNSSVTKQVIERLYACSSILNDAGPVRVLRPGRRLPDHRQRGRRQALRDERPLQPAAPRLHHPAAGRRGLDRRGRPRPLVPRPRLRRPGERLHQPQHHLHDVESAAPGPDAQGRAAVSPPTATSARPGTPAAVTTTRIPSIVSAGHGRPTRPARSGAAGPGPPACVRLPRSLAHGTPGDEHTRDDRHHQRSGDHRGDGGHVQVQADVRGGRLRQSGRHAGERARASPGRRGRRRARRRVPPRPPRTSAVGPRCRPPTSPRRSHGACRGRTCPCCWPPRCRCSRPR